MSAHKHRKMSAAAREVPFSGPVAQPENPRAHGGITRIDLCSCGATRKTNISAGHSEVGRWEEP